MLRQCKRCSTMKSIRGKKEICKRCEEEFDKENSKRYVKEVESE